MSYDIFHHIHLYAPLDKVYKAISDPDEINNWWTKECSGIPEIGQEYRLYFSKEYDWLAEASITEENRHFELKMTRSDEDWKLSYFGFKLVENGDFVVLDFYHKGWLVINEHFKRSNYCWAMLLNLLKRYVELDEVVAFEERDFMARLY